MSTPTPQQMIEAIMKAAKDQVDKENEETAQALKLINEAVKNNPEVKIIGFPDNLKNNNDSREITSKDRSVTIVSKGKRSLVPPALGNLVYREGDDTVSSLSFTDGNGSIQQNNYKPEDIIRLAKVLQADKIKQRLDMDMEAEVDHAALARELLTKQEDDGSIQVLEGNEHVALDMFSGNNAQSIRDAVHHIEVNQLQEVAPWSIVWHLWKCLQEVGGGSDQT